MSGSRDEREVKQGRSILRPRSLSDDVLQGREDGEQLLKSVVNNRWGGRWWSRRDGDESVELVVREGGEEGEGIWTKGLQLRKSDAERRAFLEDPSSSYDVLDSYETLGEGIRIHDIDEGRRRHGSDG